MPKTSPRLADDRMCFGCGSRNPRGLKLEFTLDSRHRRIRTRWVPSKEFQGYADIVHGGMIGLVLDELMVNLLWKLKLPSVTAEMTVRFFQPASVATPLECEAWIVSEKGRLYGMEATAKTSKGRLIAQATTKCVRVR